METIDALFLSYYEDIDRWHNDFGAERSAPTGSRAPVIQKGASGDRTILARMARQSAGIDGGLYDFARFLSWTRYGHTREYRRYDAFTPIHLSGAYFESLLARNGYRAVHVNHVTRLDLEQLAREFAPRYLLLSTTFMTEMANILDALQHLRRLWPGVPIVLGGLVLVELEKSVDQATFVQFLRSWGADAYVISPRAEQQLLAILAHDASELSKLDLPATWVRRDGDYVVGAGDDSGLAIDEHFVRWDELDPMRLYHLVHTRTARSCAFTCSFCSYFSNQGPLTLENPKTLEEELRRLKATGVVRSIIFTDDTFNVPRRRFSELLDVLAKFDFEWYSFFRAQYADDDTAARMRDAGCRSVFLGIESLDDAVLKNMNKVATHDAYSKGIRELKRAGIACHANFIIGFPGDVPANTRKVIDFIDEHDVDFFCVTPWYCSPATPIWREREKYGVSGRFWQWSHATMNSEQAMELEENAILAPKRSVFMSELSAQSGWHEFLMYANGLSPAEAREVTRLFNSLGGRDTSSAVIRARDDFRRAEAILRAHPFADPPPVGRVAEPHTSA